MSAEPIAAIALALAAAAVWGAGDFAGGLVTRRAPPGLVVSIAHGAGLLLLLIYLLAARVPLPGHHAVIFGLTGGIAGGLGLMAFYKALSLGEMGPLASLTGVLTALLPVAVSMLREGVPGPVTLAGFVAAVVAIWLIAYGPGGELHARGLSLAIAAGLCFGLMLVMLQISARGGVLWAMGLSRIGSTTTAICTAMIGGTWKPAPTKRLQWRRILPLAVAAGLLDTAGNLFYTFSAIKGRLDIAAVLSSLYPAGTILLAAWLLRERTTRTQALSMGIAMAAVVLISV